jgi:hypothetical protein
MARFATFRIATGCKSHEPNVRGQRLELAVNTGHRSEHLFPVEDKHQAEQHRAAWPHPGYEAMAK